MQTRYISILLEVAGCTDDQVTEIAQNAASYVEDRYGKDTITAMFVGQPHDGDEDDR